METKLKTANPKAAMFHLPIFFPRGPSGRATARTKFEVDAKDKLRKDMRRLGYEMISGTFTVAWESSFQGQASAAGQRIAGRINGHGIDDEV